MKCFSFFFSFSYPDGTLKSSCCQRREFVSSLSSFGWWTVLLEGDKFWVLKFAEFYVDYYFFPLCWGDERKHEVLLSDDGFGILCICFDFLFLPV